MNKRNSLPKVNDCIAYIESCGWKLVNRYRTVYYFKNEDICIEHKQMRFTLSELRHAYVNGW